MPCLRSWSLASRRAHRTAARTCLWALAILVLPTSQGAEPFAVGNDHYFNREFDEAVQWFQQRAEQEPRNPTVRFLLGKALLYKELHRLGMVGTSAFRGDKEYNSIKKPKPDPEANALIRETLAGAHGLCERILETRPDDRSALYTLARVLALRGGFEFMVAKAYFKALASGRRARAVSYKVGELYPDFVDGVLVAGLDEYILGSLPWAARALIALSGYRGNKRKGAEIIARVASDGTESRNEARVLLALVHRKDRRHAEAAAVFRSLAEDFPRAYTYVLESAAMHAASGDKQEALALFREVERKRVAGEDRYDRMSERLAAALARRIEGMERDLTAD